MEWMLIPLKRYADFSGRSQRMEYWMFILFIALVIGVGVIVAIVLADSGPKSGDLSGAAGIVLGLVGLFYLAMLIPLFAAQARRFHDQDLSGWMLLLQFIPYVGGIILLVFMCIDGTPGPNRFGSDPKGRGDHDARIFA